MAHRHYGRIDAPDAIACDNAKTLTNGAHADRPRLRMTQRFRQNHESHERNRPDHGEHGHKACAPAEPHGEKAAQNGRHDRRDAHDRAHDGQLAAGPRAFIHISDNGPRHDDGPRAANSLQHARQRQPFDRGSERAQRRADEIRDEADHQQGLAAVLV